MGTLTYGTRDIPVEDRLLAHLSVVVTQKLRRRESFLLTLPSGDRSLHSEGLWISASSDLTFSYSGNRVPAFDHHWLEQMMNESFSVTGLDLTTRTESAVPRRIVNSASRRREPIPERRAS